MTPKDLALAVRHAFWAACAVGGVTLLSTAVLAQDGPQVAAIDQAMPMDHSHCAAMAAAASTEGYKRTLHSYDAIPDLVLTDADAQPVRLRELLAGDDPVMLNFIFTTCTTICPVMTKVFADARTILGHEADKLRMVSISIDPENDTSAQLHAYARKFGADSHWTFLTGRVPDVAAVQRAFDAYDSDKMNHQPLTLLRATPGGKWLRIDGFATPEQLAGEYRATLSQDGATDRQAGL